MHKELSIIFKPLFDNCLFSNNEIDRSIKYSFFSALYDNAQDVISMYFVHNYIYSFKENHYTHRNTKYNDEYVKGNLKIDDNYICESFHDKRNYNGLMNQLETQDYLNVGIIASCNSSEKRVNKPNILKTNLENIIRLGRDYDCDNLQKNAVKAITRI